MTSRPNLTYGVGISYIDHMAVCSATYKGKVMYQLLYTTNMQPVCTGDVVHFSQRAWTVEEICNNDSYLKCWAWVRSMDEQRLCIRVSGGNFGAQFTLTR